MSHQARHRPGVAVGRAAAYPPEPTLLSRRHPIEARLALVDEMLRRHGVGPDGRYCRCGTPLRFCEVVVLAHHFGVGS